MPSAVFEGAVPRETTWPDVGLAIVGFAKEDSWGFATAVIAVGVAFWLAFRLPERVFRKKYLHRLARARDGETQDSSSRGGTDD